MKAWVHLEGGVVKGAILSTVRRDMLAAELGEWVLDGLKPELHDFGDEPVVVGAPLPVRRQSELFQ